MTIFRFLLLLTGLFSALSGAWHPGLTVDSPEKNPAVTYAEQVAPILNRHCVDCHRPGEVAPFSLIGYENARKWSKMIANVTELKRMPPWKPVHGYNEFLGENRLTAAEIELLKKWSDVGAPRGNPAKEPPQPRFSSDWTLGTPDLVLHASKPYKLAAEGNDVYRNFVLPYTFQETTWIRAIDVRPGNSKIVHHAIVFLERGNQAETLEARAEDGQPGYTSFGGPGFIPAGSLGGWAPGLRPRLTPEGTAFKVEPGMKIVLQIHYHPSGKEETDLSQIALFFSKTPVTHEMSLRWVMNLNLWIPAGANHYVVSYVDIIPANATIHAVMPHMHLLGRSMKAWIELPDHSTKPLIYIDDWDFNWQMSYILKKPMHVPKGAKLHVEAVYDNSSDNPNNPNDPPKSVSFGEQTTDEMFLLIAAYTLDRN